MNRLERRLAALEKKRQGPPDTVTVPTLASFYSGDLTDVQTVSLAELRTWTLADFYAEHDRQSDPCDFG